MNKAVFLDRDGVINEMIFNDAEMEYEPPHKIENIKLYPGVIESLKKLIDRKYLLFVVSNQPDHAKGKTTLENLYQVKEKIKDILDSNGIHITEYYYCIHHPEGIVKEYSFDCECRKPKTFFSEKAISDYDILRGLSWMIGDRETDILFGKDSGFRTIKINNKYYPQQVNILPDYNAESLEEAVRIILNS